MLASLIRDSIAPFVRECPPACGVVSITEVMVSDDLRIATVFVSALFDTDAAIAFLEEHRGQLHSSLARLQRKHIPELRFVADKRGEKGRRIEALLDDEDEPVT